MLNIDTLNENSDLINIGFGQDYLWGFNGEDILIGYEGQNWLSGGNNNDLLIVNNPWQHQANGGDGEDTLLLNFSATSLSRDVTSHFDWSEQYMGQKSRTTNIEIFDLGDSTDRPLDVMPIGEFINGEINLLLSVSDVVDITDSDNILYINGDSYDSVTFDTTSVWRNVGISDGYTHYESYENRVSVYVETEVIVTNPVSTGTVPEENKSNDNLLIGTGQDFLYGYDGDDILIAYAQQNWLNGGNDDDLLIVNNPWQHLTAGGDGEDTLKLNFSATSLGRDITSHFDWSAQYMTQLYRTTNIEILDLGDASDLPFDVMPIGEFINGDFGLYFSQSDLVQMTDDDNVLFIKGDTNDTVTLDITDAWSYVGSVDGYNQYEAFPGATLYIDSEVAVANAETDINIKVGTEGHDLLIGHGDALYGLGGSDTLSAFEGANWLDGGEGNDLFIVYNWDSHQVDGGEGTDTLFLNVGDLKVDWSETYMSSHTSNIEIVDLGKDDFHFPDLPYISDNNVAWVIDKYDIRDITDENNTLFVLGDIWDSVRIEDSRTEGWRIFVNDDTAPIAGFSHTGAPLDDGTWVHMYVEEGMAWQWL